MGRIGVSRQISRGGSDRPFAFQPSIDERHIRELANLAFVAEAANIPLLGPPRRGPDPSGRGSGPPGHREWPGAYFVRAYDMMEDLRKTQIEHNLDRRMRGYLPPRVLVMDEFGI